MKTKRNSPEYSFLHTQQRLKERYNLDITKQEYEKLRFQMIPVMPDYMETNSNETQGIYTLLFKGKRVIFVFSFTKHCIKTVLPPRTHIN